MSERSARTEVAAAEPTAFLYPFIDGDERDEDTLLADLAASARAKAETSWALARSTVADLDGELDAAARAISAATTGGGRIFTFGNGGSATDADAAARRLRDLGARSLVADPALLTALANDVGFDVVFARQLAAHGRRGDVAIAFSTSGGSRNVLAGIAEARRIGMVTIGLCGYDGGAMAAGGDLDHCLIVRSDSVHRIQEVQSVLLDELYRRTEAVHAWGTGGRR